MNKTCPNCDRADDANAKRCFNCGYPYWFAKVNPLFRMRIYAWQAWFGIVLSIILLPVLPFVYASVLRERGTEPDPVAVTLCIISWCAICVGGILYSKM